jgi:hypothetical protein
VVRGAAQWLGHYLGVHKTTVTAGICPSEHSERESTLANCDDAGLAPRCIVLFNPVPRTDEPNLRRFAPAFGTVNTGSA